MSRNGQADPAPAGGWLEGDQRRAWLAYIRVQLRLAYEMNRQLLADSGMSLPDYDVLTALSVADGGRMPITVLAAQIGWERSRVSHHVRRMSARGLVTCGLSAADRRVTEVTLTGRGRQALEEAAPGHVDLVRRLFFGGLPAAWWGRSARRWKACTRTSSSRARSRRRSTGTWRGTDGARLPPRSRAGRRAPRLELARDAPASDTAAAERGSRSRPSLRRSRPRPAGNKVLVIRVTAYAPGDERAPQRTCACPSDARPAFPVDIT